MTIIDYLLLAGFFAASIYTVYRLFLGWRNSPSTEVQADSPEKASPTQLPMTTVQSPASTGAPWQQRRSTEGRNR
jgi:hypothetical protein